MLKQIAKTTINNLITLRDTRIEQLLSDNPDLDCEDELVESITSLIEEIEIEYLEEATETNKLNLKEA